MGYIVALLIKTTVALGLYLDTLFSPHRMVPTELGPFMDTETRRGNFWSGLASIAILIVHFDAQSVVNITYREKDFNEYSHRKQQEWNQTNFCRSQSPLL